MSASANAPETGENTYITALASRLMAAIGMKAENKLEVELRDYMLERAPPKGFFTPDEFFTSDTFFSDLKSRRFKWKMRRVVRAIVGLYLTEEARTEGACRVCHSDLESFDCRLCSVFAREGGVEYLPCAKCGIFIRCSLCDEEHDETVKSVGAEGVEELEVFCALNRTPGPDGNLRAIPNADALRAEYLEHFKRDTASQNWVEDAYLWYHWVPTPKLQLQLSYYCSNGVKKVRLSFFRYDLQSEPMRKISLRCGTFWTHARALCIAEEHVPELLK